MAPLAPIQASSLSDPDSGAATQVAGPSSNYPPKRENASRLGRVFSIWAYRLNQEKIMEAWKLHKFCESATLEQLEQVRDVLRAKVDSGQLTETNARYALGLVEKYIDLKRIFE